MLTVEQFQYMEDKVLEWNKVFGNDLNDKSLIPTYVNLCIEEGSEYVKADQTDNHVEKVDALVDSVYTGFMLNRLQEGQSYGKWFSAVITDNMTTPSLRILLSALKEYEYIYGYTTNLPVILLEESEHYDIFNAFKLITESNFSKAAPLSVDIESEIEYITSQGRYADVFAEESNGYIIFKAKQDLQEGNTFEKGKIVKWRGYKSPEDLGGLEQFIY